MTITQKIPANYASAHRRCTDRDIPGTYQVGCTDTDPGHGRGLLGVACGSDIFLAAEGAQRHLVTDHTDYIDSRGDTPVGRTAVAGRHA